MQHYCLGKFINQTSKKLLSEKKTKFLSDSPLLFLKFDLTKYVWNDKILFVSPTQPLQSRNYFPVYLNKKPVYTIILPLCNFAFVTMRTTARSLWIWIMIMFSSFHTNIKLAYNAGSFCFISIPCHIHIIKRIRKITIPGILQV